PASTSSRWSTTGESRPRPDLSGPPSTVSAPAADRDSSRSWLCRPSRRPPIARSRSGSSPTLRRRVPEPRTQNRGPRTPNPEPRTPNPIGAPSLLLRRPGSVAEPGDVDLAFHGVAAFDDAGVGEFEAGPLGVGGELEREVPAF